MRGLVASVVAVATLVAAGAAVAQSKVALKRCAPRAASIISTSKTVETYELGGVIYGCDRSTKKRSALGAAGGAPTAMAIDGQITLRGDLAAYAVTPGSPGGIETVNVRRLSDGRVLRSYNATTLSYGPGFAGWELNVIVVKPDSSVAWTVTAFSPSFGHSVGVEVHANAKLLDSGTGVVSYSLQLHKSKLTWRDGSVTRSATLQ